MKNLIFKDSNFAGSVGNCTTMMAALCERCGSTAENDVGVGSCLDK